MTAVAAAPRSPSRSRTFIPPDVSRCEHLSQFDCKVWESPDGDRCIIRLVDGASAIGPGSASQFDRGVLYNFMGKWEEPRDAKFGWQFRFTTFTTVRHQSADAFVKYLAKTCRNVGEATARALYTRYGNESARKLREEPETVAADGILSLSQALEAAEDLQKFARFENTRIQLNGLFAGHGFPGKLIDECIRRWNVKAPSIVRRNPFAMLVHELPGCGFKRCDKLYLELELPPNALKRVALAAWSHMQSDSTGSTWFDARDVIDTLKMLVPKGDYVRALTLLKRSQWMQTRRVEKRLYVSPFERAEAERRIRDSIRRLNAHPSLWPTEKLVGVEGGNPSPHQVEQLHRATRKAVGCFIGGPGTGKTTTVAAMLREVFRTPGRTPSDVAVAAPTGKASVRIGEAMADCGLDLLATTIHRLLEIGRNGHDGEGWRFQRNLTRPLNEQFILIDESSMSDVELAADLLDAIPDGSNVLFIGDTFQLPPVGHGAPLRDLIVSGAVSVGELTQIHRNAGSIVLACDAIKNARWVQFPDKIDLDSPAKKNLLHIEASQIETPNIVEAVLRSMSRFDRIWETQIITGLNEKSVSSRQALNPRIGQLLNPDGRGTPNNPFRVDDKIICRKNCCLKTVVSGGITSDPAITLDANWYVPPHMDPKEWYVANGEIGRAIAVSDTATVVQFGIDAPLVAIPMPKAKRNAGEGGDASVSEDQQKLKFEPAWAITVHSSQGSQWPCVICPIDKVASRIADRNYWYTAISRAQKLCILVGPKSVFERQAKKVSIDRRLTFLREELVSLRLEELEEGVPL